MSNRMKNICILAILIIFLLIVATMPVTCLFKQVTGIYCPTCGMTRAFISIIFFNFKKAFLYNILSIPLFLFIVISSFMLIYEIIKNKFNYITRLLKILSNKYVIIVLLFLLIISFIINNTIPKY